MRCAPGGLSWAHWGTPRPARIVFIIKMYFIFCFSFHFIGAAFCAFIGLSEPRGEFSTFRHWDLDCH